MAVYTVKRTRAKLPANAGNFTHGMQVKRPHTQFTCVTCNLPVKTGKFTRVYPASASRRLHANCLQPHVNLPEHKGYFTGDFICGTYANLPATGMQNCLLLQTKIPALAGKNTCQTQAKVPAIAGKDTCNCTQNYQ